MKYLYALFLACLVAVSAQAAPNHIVISQVYGAGGTSGALYKNDYVELYNPTGADVPLTGYSLQYASGSASSQQVSWFAAPLTGTIKAGRYYLAAFSSSGTTGTALTPDFSSTNISMGSSAGKVALVNSATTIGSVTCPTADATVGSKVVDFVGYGTTANCSETNPAPAPGTTTADLRGGSPRGTIDTDNNAADFSAAAPDPRNSSYVPAVTDALAFTTQPSGAMAGAAFASQPVVTVKTSGGATDTSFNGAVTLSIKSGTGAAGAVLNGTATVNAVNGVATFSRLSIGIAGTGYVLSATATGATGGDSAAFDVAALPSAQLAFSVQPGDGTAGAPLSVQPVVEAKDAGGAVVTSFNGAVTVAIKSGTGTTGAALTGTTTVNAVNGIATFTNLSVDMGGSDYALTASASGAAPAESAMFDVAAPLGPAQLQFSTQPSGAMEGVAFDTQPVVKVQDANGTTVTTYNGPVSLTIKAGTGTDGAILSGTATVNAVGGVATFSGLSIDAPGTGYVLTADVSGVPSGDSAAFDVTALVASQLAFSVQPGGAKAGTAFTTQPSVRVEDASGRLVTDFTGTVTVDVKAGTGVSGAVVSGTTTVDIVNGIAAFTDLSVNLDGSGYVLTATSEGLASADSAAFTVAPADVVPASLAFTTPPAGGTAGALLSSQPVVTVKDANGTAVAAFSGPVTLTLSGGANGAALGGTTTVNAVHGVATFTDLTVDKAGTNYVLTASGAGFTTNSAAFIISATPPPAGYTITDLGTLSFPDTGTYAYAVNAGGKAAGYSGHPVLFSNGTVTDANPALPASIFALAPARDINAAGTMVGYYNAFAAIGTVGGQAANAYMSVHAFKWSAGTFTDLTPTSTVPAKALAINGLGDILIAAATNYVLKNDGTTVNLSGFVAGTALAPADLNDAGQVAGTSQAADLTDHATLWQNGSAQDLGTLPLDTNSEGKGINATGTVVGDSYGPASTLTNTRAFLWKNGTMTALPARATGESYVARAVNGTDQVVGYVGIDRETGQEAGALLWANGQVRDLGTLIPQDGTWTLSAAMDINDAGQIVGLGLHNNLVRAFLLTPVAPPKVVGDANGDGAVTAADAILVLQMAGGLLTASDVPNLDVAPYPSSAASGYGDGAITILDAARILRKANGLETHWP